MNILAIDTSGPFAGAALMQNGVVTHEISACHGLTHSQTSLPMAREVLEAASLLTVRSAEHDGRLRKYYHITDAGSARIEEFKEDWKEIMSIYQFVTREEQAND